MATTSDFHVRKWAEAQMYNDIAPGHVWKVKQTYADAARYYEVEMDGIPSEPEADPLERAVEYAVRELKGGS
jgi:hypothetical protein